LVLSGEATTFFAFETPRTRKQLSVAVELKREESLQGAFSQRVEKRKVMSDQNATKLPAARREKKGRKGCASFAEQGAKLHSKG